MKTLKKMQKTVLLILKLLLFALLFGIFFFIFGIDRRWLWRPSRTAAVTMLTFAVLGTALMAVYGGYVIGVRRSRSIVRSMTLSAVLTDLVTHLQLCVMNTNAAHGRRFVYLSPELLLLVMGLQFIVIAVFAYSGNRFYFSMNPPENCVVVTASEHSLNAIASKIKKYKKQYRITDTILFTDRGLYEILGRCDTVFICDVPFLSRCEIIEFCYANNKNVCYNFEICDIVSLRSRVSMLDDKPLVDSHIRGLTFEQAAVKRAMDLAISAVGLIVLSPLMLGCAAAIKSEDGGRVFFRQERATKDGKIFRVCKFRTMREENPVNRSVTAGDGRVTRVGQVLRKYRLDELPQLFNILKGEMSIVGPRPEMVENVDEYTEDLPEFSYRLRVKAGLTGLAQISGKYNTSPKDKLALDLMYIEKYSLWQDVKLIFQTLTVFFKASESTEAFKNAERTDKNF